MKQNIINYFGIDKANSTIKKEFTGGLTAFLSMSYIIFVNPIILSQAGIPESAVFIATILSSSFAMLLMGLYAKTPLGLAPCMSMNAFFAFSAVLGQGLSWQTALSAVFVGAILFILLSISGARSKIIKAIPETVKQAGTVGLGLFIAFVSFKNSGIIVADPSSYIAFGGFHNPNVIIAIIGIAVAAIFLLRKSQYAVFFGMLGAAIAGILFQFAIQFGWLSYSPEIVASLPRLPEGSPLAFPVEPFKVMFDQTFLVALKSLPTLLNPTAIVTVLTFLFLDFFGTATTLAAASTQIPHIPEEEFMQNKKIYVVDAIASAFGALVGTSSLTTYIESVSGIIAGGRTGLVAVVNAILFLLSLFLYPLLSLVTSAVTTPALVFIGIFMMQNITNIEWNKGFEKVIPAFLTIVMMPLTGSIALGLTIGFISYEFCMIVVGKGKELGNIMHFITAISILYMMTL